MPFAFLPRFLLACHSPHEDFPLSALFTRVLAVGLGVLAASSAGRAAPYEIAVVPKGTTHEFPRKSVHAGAVKAERELTAAGIEVHVIWKGPLREDDREQQIHRSWRISWAGK